MSFVEITGKTKEELLSVDKTYKGEGGIPEGSIVKVCAVYGNPPKYEEIQTFEDVSGSVGIPLDHGKYAVMVRRRKGPLHKAMKYSYEFLQGLNEEQYQALQELEPKMFTARLTSDGLKLQCKVIACTFKTTSPTQAILHEAKHGGVDLLKELATAPTTEAKENIIETVSKMAARTAAEAPKIAQESIFQTKNKISA